MSIKPDPQPGGIPPSRGAWGAASVGGSDDSRVSKPGLGLRSETRLPDPDEMRLALQGLSAAYAPQLKADDTTQNADLQKKIELVKKYIDENLEKILEIVNEEHRGYAVKEFVDALKEHISFEPEIKQYISQHLLELYSQVIKEDRNSQNSNRAKTLALILWQGITYDDNSIYSLLTQRARKNGVVESLIKAAKENKLLNDKLLQTILDVHISELSPDSSRIESTRLINNLQQSRNKLSLQTISETVRQGFIEDVQSLIDLVSEIKVQLELESEDEEGDLLSLSDESNTPTHKLEVLEHNLIENLEALDARLFFANVLFAKKLRSKTEPLTKKDIDDVFDLWFYDLDLCKDLCEMAPQMSKYNAHDYPSYAALTTLCNLLIDSRENIDEDLRKAISMRLVEFLESYYPFSGPRLAELTCVIDCLERFDEASTKRIALQLLKKLNISDQFREVLVSKVVREREFYDYLVDDIKNNDNGSHTMMQVIAMSEAEQKASKALSADDSEVKATRKNNPLRRLLSRTDIGIDDLIKSNNFLIEFEGSPKTEFDILDQIASLIDLSNADLRLDIVAYKLVDFLLRNKDDYPLEWFTNPDGACVNFIRTAVSQFSKA